MSDSHAQPSRPRPAAPSPKSPKDTPSPERKPGAGSGGNGRPQRRPKPTPEELAAALEARRAPANRVPPITFPEALPVSARRDEIAEAIAKHQVVIVSGETGSGKTTQLPKICLSIGRGIGAGGTGLIGHTQPRRIAATSTAKRIAQEIGTPVGEHVGYQVRFNDALSAGASVKLMTDGILLAETQNDPLLRAYDTIIIDEAHDLTVPMLKYLKRFWELEDGMRRLLGIVLIGQPELKLKLSERNADLREVVRRCEQIELQPLNAFVADYLTHKLRRLDVAFEDVFAADAVGGLVARLTRPSADGKQVMSLLYPLIVNNTVTAALNEAARLGQNRITADIFNAI